MLNQLFQFAGVGLFIACAFLRPGTIELRYWYSSIGLFAICVFLGAMAELVLFVAEKILINLGFGDREKK